MKPHNSLNGTDFHGTCPDTGKRQYATRKHARKARQVHSHTRGAPYRCDYCDYFHLGRYKQQKTRDGYRDTAPDLIEVTALAEQLDVAPQTLRVALKGLSIPVTNDRAPADTLDRLKALTYRAP